MTSARELLIFGAGGMLGTALVQVADRSGHVVRALAKSEVDITDREAVDAEIVRFASRVIRSGSAGAVVNAAAYTNVDKAEEEPDRAFLVNGRAPGWLAAAALRGGLPFVHVSTDFVFDGKQASDYVEEDEPHPLNVYGASKLLGEREALSHASEALVVRTSWVFGPHGNNFPAKILERARLLAGGPQSLRVVADEVGCPTYASDLAVGLLGLLDAGAGGIYHLAGSGSCSRHELAVETVKLAGLWGPGGVMVEPISADMLPTKVARPARAVLDCGKAARLGVALPPWREGLAHYVSGL